MDKQTHTTQDFKGLTDWVELFKVGTQTDSKGRTKEFSLADLDSVVTNLDPAHPPKHVITHKELYSPFGYGDVAELKVENGSLFAKSTNIESQFEALVENGRLPDRSIRLLPVENGYKLGHVAWLGAEPPAVEGLAPVEFNADDVEAFDFTMHNDWYTPNVLSRFMRRVREFFIAEHGVEKANELIPEWEIEGITEHAIDIRKENEPSGSMFSSPDDGGSEVTNFTQADLDAAAKKAADDAVAAAKNDFAKEQADKDQELQKERHERLRMEFSHEVAGLVGSNKLTPAMAAGAADFMAGLASGDEAAFEFSAGDGDGKKDFKKDPLSWFRDFMAAMPAHKLNEEIGGGDGVDFDNAEAIAAAALEFQKSEADAGRDIGMAQAVAHVTKGEK